MGAPHTRTRTVAARLTSGRRVSSVIHPALGRLRVRLRPKRLTAERCADCRKKLYHPGPKEWRAVGRNVAIRCLDCRHAYCPACAKKHFAPVRAGRAKLMNAFVNAALKAMNHKCRHVRHPSKGLR